MKYSQILGIFLVGCTFFVGSIGRSQLVTNAGIAPAQLVQNTLLNSGVTVVNVNYSGPSSAIGTFNGSSTNLGLNSGVIMTTGTILNTNYGPHGPNDREDAGLSANFPGTNLLASQTGPDTHDAAILEIDFIPDGNNIAFEYVFASEEWPTYQNSGYNDAFGLFLSGPGFASPTNIATLPGGGVVAIPNVNNGSTNSGPCVNCQYYVANGMGNSGPQSTSDYYLQYNGFTTALTAEANVQCGQQYRLTIVVVDAVGGGYDSGLFLKANSFTSEPVISAAASLLNDHYGDNYSLAEGCETATITVTRDDASAPLTLPIQSLGQAQSGVDFAGLPSSISFNAGQASASFAIDITSDNINEGNESLLLQFDYPAFCGSQNYFELELEIVDIDPLTIDLLDSYVNCPGDLGLLQPVVSGGLPPYEFLWSTGSTHQVLQDYPNVTTVYDLEVTDQCIGFDSESAELFVPEFDSIAFLSVADTAVLCPNTPVPLSVEVAGGNGNYSFQWFQGNLLLGNDSTQLVSPMVTTSYTVMVIDGCGNQNATSLTVTVQTSVLTIESIDIPDICPYDSVLIGVNASEGTGNYYYGWGHSSETTAHVIVNPNFTTNYYVSVQDDCGTYSIDSTLTVNVVVPEANFEFTQENHMAGLPVTCSNLTIGGLFWYWDFGDGQTSNEPHPSVIYSIPNDYTIQLIAENHLGCRDTTFRNVRVRPELHVYVPNTFTPDGDEFNNTFVPKVTGENMDGYLFQIYNRWGQLLFESKNPDVGWDGHFGGKQVPSSTYIWRLRLEDQDGIPYEYKGHVNLLR